jgi:hypothetical protein
MSTILANKLSRINSTLLMVWNAGAGLGVPAAAGFFWPIVVVGARRGIRRRTPLTE